jgi:hypothetical protein
MRTSSLWLVRVCVDDGFARAVHDDDAKLGSSPRLSVGKKELWAGASTGGQLLG